MKKVLAFLLCVALAVTSFVTAFAAEPKIVCTASEGDVKMGDTFTVTISLSDYEPIKAAGILFVVDQSVLEVISGEWLVSNPALSDFNPTYLTATFAYSSAQDINGDIFRLTLKAKSDLSWVGETDIQIQPQLMNQDNEDVATETSVTTTVTVSCAEHEYGNLIPAVPAKCGTAGKKAYYECSVCHKLFDENRTETTEAELVIPALTHVAEEGWRSDGDNHWKVCVNDGCGQVIDGTTASHSFEWVVDTPATEDAPGVRHEECTVCEYTRNENSEIPQLPHVHTGITHHEAVAANCHETGTVEYWTCSSDKCAGKYYGDAECSTELASITTPIAPDNHAGGTEIRNAVEATCGENGYTGDTHCLGCGEKLADGTTIPATGKHTDDDGEWESDGADHWHICGDCGTTFDKAAHEGGEATCSAKAVCETCGAEYGALDPDNHVNTEIRDAVAATEESEGYTGDTWCLDCETMIAEGTVISKLDHTHEMVKTEAKAATHEEDGNIEYYTCSKCGKKYNDEMGTRELTDEEIVFKATGHNYGDDWKTDEINHWHECDCGEQTDIAAHIFGDWTVTQEATETADGNRERKCTICGYMQSEVINAAGESPDDNETGETDTPQTGDNTNIIIWMVMMITGGCGVIITMTVRKKYKA